MLEQITPVIITYNEAPNIARTLDQLRWARDIVVVDSYSDDETLKILAAYPQVRVVQRAFDNFANQCNYALEHGDIRTEWVLNLDADYVLTQELIDELAALESSPAVNGYRAHFTYCINGRRLRSGIYPPVTVLFRRQNASYQVDGHAHKVMVAGLLRDLKGRILHDDRKPLGRWFRSQLKYAALEAHKLKTSAQLGRNDRLRKWLIVAPPAVLFYCLFVRCGILDGWPGLCYAAQRFIAELILSFYLIAGAKWSDGQLSDPTRPDCLITELGSSESIDQPGPRASTLTT